MSTIYVSKLLSELPHVRHSFTTRDEGVSTGPFTSLNLSVTVGDPRPNVEANRRAVLARMGRPEATWVSVKQVHADAIVQVTASALRFAEADALWTRDRGAAVAVLVADCVPILIADVKGRVIAAVHAGWRGTELKVAAKVVKRLADEGIKPTDLRVAMGPAIGPLRFEVGAEVLTKLRTAMPAASDAIRDTATDKGVVDLWELNRLQLVEAGVVTEHIEAIRVCTYDTPTLFSHRRDGGTTGRQAGVIAFAPGYMPKF